MKQLHVLERDAAPDQVTRAAAGDCAWNLTVVYHDERTLAWAKEVYARVVKPGAREGVRATWWKVSDLAEPGVLAGAVSTAMRAEVVVVAIDAANGLPLPFHVWVDHWLPHRRKPTGCLFALVGRSAPANGHSARVREYLREVARMGQLEFVLEERRLAGQSTTSPRVRPSAPVSAPPAPAGKPLASAACAR